MNTTKFFKINGKEIPAPARGLEYILTNFVSAGRDANGRFVGEVIGRTQYKINNLEWKAVNQEVAETILKACEDFVFEVEFVDPITNNFRKLQMYCGDRTVKPYYYNPKVEDGSIGSDDDKILMYEYIRVNIIDCGEVEGDDERAIY